MRQWPRLLPRALEHSIKGQEAKRKEGRSIRHCPGLYHPLSSSFPPTLGLRAWLLGGSEARRMPRRLPGRLKSCNAGGKRFSGGGFASPCGRAGRPSNLCLCFQSEQGEGWAGGPGPGCPARCRRRQARAAERVPEVGSPRAGGGSPAGGRGPAASHPGPSSPKQTPPAGRAARPWSPSPTNCSSSCPS